MLKRKPLYPTNFTPDEIIGDPNDVGVLESHFTLSLKETDAERYEKAMQRKFSEAERTHFSALYARLREHGIWPRSINKFGGIEWGIAVRGDLQDYVESLPLIPKEEFNEQWWR